MKMPMAWKAQVCPTFLGASARGPRRQAVGSGRPSCCPATPNPHGYQQERLPVKAAGAILARPGRSFLEDRRASFWACPRNEPRKGGSRVPGALPAHFLNVSSSLCAWQGGHQPSMVTGSRGGSGGACSSRPLLLRSAAACVFLLGAMSTDAGGHVPRGPARSALFLRHVPSQPSGGFSAYDIEGSLSPRNTALKSGTYRRDAEDKIKPAPKGWQGSWAGQTRILFRRALELMSSVTSGGDGGSSGGQKPMLGHQKRPAGHQQTRTRRGSSLGSHAQGLLVGNLLQQAAGALEGERANNRAGSAADRISINITSREEGSCPTDLLVAPCAVPSASLKEFGASREEGIVVPVTFQVGDCVDFITRLSKLDKYSDKTTSRSLERIFVTDCGRLVGYVTSMDLLVAPRTEALSRIVRSCEVVVSETDDYDDAVMAMRAKGLTYAPVVDSQNVVVGIITPTDMLNEMEMEATDDVMRFSGSGGGESYFGTSLVQLVTARAGWLISLLMLQSLSSVILTRFSALIERHLVIALFLTMLTGTAGNAGNQSSAMVIRGLATGEINRKNAWKVIVRELKAAVLMSVLLGIASFFRVYVTPGSTLMSTVAVTIAMVVTVVGACFLGTFAPIILDRLGLDPCNCASPALATMTDVSGVLILCAISSMLLGGSS